MESREFVADPEEATTRWIYRPPDIPQQAPTHCDVSYPLPLPGSALGLHDPSTSIDLQYVPQPTSLAPFQPDQLLAEPAGHTQAIKANLPEDVQRRLAEVEWQHEVARYQILEKAQAIPAISHVQEAPASFPHVATDGTATEYAGVYDTSNVPVRLAQIPNHGLILDQNTSAYGVDAGSCPAQQLTQVNVYPNSACDHVGGYGQQYNTFLNARDLDYNALEHSAYGQRSSLAPTALKASNFDTMPSTLSLYDQGGHLSSFIATTQVHSNQQSLPLLDFGAVAITASQLPTNATNDYVHDTTDPSARPLWDGNIDSSADHSFAATAHELSPIQTINYSTTTTVGTTGTIGSKVPTGVIRGKAMRGKSRQSISTSPYDRGTGSGGAVDNIQFHTSPEADRQRQSNQPRTYSKRQSKSEWSCFGCRLSKRKCEIGAHGVCLRCQNILKMYSDLTVLPKFTCNIRTKFSEMSIYIDIPPGGLSVSEMDASLASSLPRSLEFELNDGLPPLTFDGFTSRFFSNLTSRLALHVRDLLDILEPLHVRQVVPDLADPVIFWSYSFSMVRWKKAICFFRPYLKDALDFYRGLHRLGHRFLLQRFERLFITKRYDDLVTYLNIWYEGISNTEDDPMVDIRAKKNLLDFFKHHLFHMYREIFPKTRRSNKARQSDDIDAKVCLSSLFSRTSSLLPENFRFCRLGYIGAALLEIQRDDFTLEYATTTVTDHETSLEFHQQSERAPLPNPYIPAKLAVILGMDTVMAKLVNSRNRELLLKQSTLHQSLAREYSPWSLSLVLRALFVHFDVENGTGKAIDPMICSLLGFSFTVWELLIYLAGQYKVPQTSESVADWIMTNRDVLEASVIDSFTDAFDELLAPYGTTFKKRSKRVV